MPERPDANDVINPGQWVLTMMEFPMSVKGHIKEAAGYVKEEANEHGTSADSQRKAQEGRDLRNEGRIEDGKAPKTTKPGADAK
jgi:hypothetical protein